MGRSISLLSPITQPANQAVVTLANLNRNGYPRRTDALTPPKIEAANTVSRQACLQYPVRLGRVALAAEGDFVLRYVPLLGTPHASVDYVVDVLGLLAAD